MKTLDTVLNNKSFFKTLFFIFKILFSKEEDKVKVLLNEARKDERKDVDNDWKEKYNNMMKQLEKDKSLAIQDKNSKIDSLLNKIEERDKRLTHVEEIYNYCWEQTKNNMNLAGELKIQVWKAQNNQSNTFQAITDIVTKSEDYMSDLKKKEEHFRKLLGWKGY